jgi:hypothetical protein
MASEPFHNFERRTDSLGWNGWNSAPCQFQNGKMYKKVKLLGISRNLAIFSQANMLK